MGQRSICKALSVTLRDAPAESVDPEKPAGPMTVKPFRLLWFNNVGFFLVANAQRFVFGWLVLDGLNRDEFDQGLAVFALGLPAAFLVLQAGVWADRLDRRMMLITTQAAGAVVMALAALLAQTDRISFAWVIALTLLAGTASAIGQPVRSSLIPALVSKQQLLPAIAVNAIAITASLILGPVVAKLVGDAYGFAGAFWFQAGLLGIGILFLLPLEVPPVISEGPRRSIRSELGEAGRHIWGDPALRTLFCLLFLSSATINPAVMVTLQAHIKEAFERDSGDAAIPFALMGLGIAISSVFVMKKGDMKNKGAAFQRAMMAGSTITIIIGQLPTFGLILLFTFFMGLAGGFYINMNQGLIQSSTPQHLMGRVMGVFAMSQAGLMPIGALALGAVAQRLGTGNTITFAAAIGLLGVGTTYIRSAELRRLG